MPNTLQDLSPSALITAIAASEIAYYRNFSRLPNAQLFDEPDLLWLASGLPVFNAVLHAHTTEEQLGPQIERVIAYFRSRKLAFNWYVGPLSQPASIKEHLPRYGVHHDEDEPGMALDLDELNEDVPLAPALVSSRSPAMNFCCNGCIPVAFLSRRTPFSTFSRLTTLCMANMSRCASFSASWAVGL